LCFSPGSLLDGGVFIWQWSHKSDMAVWWRIRGAWVGGSANTVTGDRLLTLTQEGRAQHFWPDCRFPSHCLVIAWRAQMWGDRITGDRLLTLLTQEGRALQQSSPNEKCRVWGLNE
jgi:hypothetical protein